MNNAEDYDAAWQEAKRKEQLVVSSIPPLFIKKEDELPASILRSKGNIFSKLSRLYEFIDRLYSHFLQHIPCKKGCSYCCSLEEIAITGLDILFIEKSINKKRLKIPRTRTEIMGKQCAFLENGSCSIYAYRPFVCRKHFSVADSKWCQPHLGKNFEFPMISFTGIEMAYAMILKESGKEKIRDIREVFGEK